MEKLTRKRDLSPIPSSHHRYSLIAPESLQFLPYHIQKPPTAFPQTTRWCCDDKMDRIRSVKWDCVISSYLAGLIEVATAMIDSRTTNVTGRRTKIPAFRRWSHPIVSDCNVPVVTYPTGLYYCERGRRPSTQHGKSAYTISICTDPEYNDITTHWTHYFNEASQIALL